MKFICFKIFSKGIFSGLRINGYKIVLLFSLMVLCSNDLWAAQRYVDKNLSANTSNYSIANRNASGNSLGYKSVKDALKALVVGDEIILRGGTYQEGCILLDWNKNGTSWSAGHFNTIKSYPGEWAILDAQNGGGTGGIDGITFMGTGTSYFGTVIDNQYHTLCVIGRSTSAKDGTGALRYWKFERLEITNGRSPNGAFAAGIDITGGPFWVTGCYIHDNYSTLANPGTNNPSGISGGVWQDSIIEYSYFLDNGTKNKVDNHNCAHIQGFSDYRPDQIAAGGIGAGTGYYNCRNTFRYNLFVGSSTAIKYKQEQFFTGRNPAGGFPYQDSLKTYGDNVHHNIIRGSYGVAIYPRQDFIQVHHNIIDDSGAGIYIGDRTIYKAVTYNNTIIRPNGLNDAPIPHGILRMLIRWYPTFEPNAYYGYDYNNIVDQGTTGWGWEEFTLRRVSYTTPTDFSGYSSARNLSYRPIAGSSDTTNTQTWLVAGLRYADDSVSSILPKSYSTYLKQYNSNDPLYVGTTGADKYKTRSEYSLASGVTIGTGGVGGNHPYLTGVTIPSYIGAVNPNDNAWVSGVLSLANVSILKSLNGTPVWIEGGVCADPNNRPSNNNWGRLRIVQ